MYLGLTQTVFAEVLQTHRNTIINRERAKRRLTYQDWIRVLDWLEKKSKAVSQEYIDELIEKLDAAWLK